MLLRNEIPCAFNTWCDVGKRAKIGDFEECQVWVKEYKGANSGRWVFYIYLQDIVTRRGRHMTWYLCDAHANSLYKEWEALAREEVDVYEATSRYDNREAEQW